MMTTQIVVGALLVALTAWTPALAADKMVIGTGVDPSVAHFYIGADAGIFKKNDLDVEVKLFSSASASAASLIPGDIQASLTSVPAGVLAHGRSPKVVLVALANVLTGNIGILAEAGIKTVPDLRGKKVGVAIGTSSEQAAIQTFERFNMTMKDVQPVNVEPPEMLAALLRKDIAGFFVWEPWLSKGKFATGDRATLVPGSEFYLVHVVLAMDRDWVQKNRAAAVRFVKAIKESSEFATQRPDEAQRLTSKFLKMDLELVKVLWAKYRFALALDDAHMQYMKKDVDSLIAGNKLGAPFDYKGYVYPDLLREVDPKAVTYTKLP
jgi:NitT/TauT family transport system substrate-binding protein